MLLYLAAALAALQGAAGSPAAAINTQEINALAQKVRSFEPKDEFDAPPAQKTLEGRRFVIEMAPWGTKPPDVACFGYPMWSYSASTGTLYVSPGGHRMALTGFSSPQGVISKGELANVVTFFASHCERLDLPSYEAKNAYGASFTIEPTKQVITAVADSIQRQLEWPPPFKVMLSGDDARALVPNLQVRLSGTLSDWSTSVAVACGARRDAPTARLPYDRRLEACLFNGRLERFEVIDGRNGRVLHSDTRPPGAR